VRRPVRSHVSKSEKEANRHAFGPSTRNPLGWYQVSATSPPGKSHSNHKLSLFPHWFSIRFGPPETAPCQLVLLFLLGFTSRLPTYQLLPLIWLPPFEFLTQFPFPKGKRSFKIDSNCNSIQRIRIEFKGFCFWLSPIVWSLIMIIIPFHFPEVGWFKRRTVTLWKLLHMSRMNLSEWKNVFPFHMTWVEWILFRFYRNQRKCWLMTPMLW